MFFKNTVYTIIIVTVFFGGVELLLALFGVRPILLSEDPLLGFAENTPLFVEASGPDGSVTLQTSPHHRRLFNYQEFPKHKADDSYRIFCMGGSTTHGRPYYDPVSFCGWLRAYLNAADPTRNWEVINAGGVSYASYRVARLMNELSQFQPDLFIVYSGQNEFLEERSYGELIKLPDWVINLNATLSGTRTYTAMMHLIDAMRSEPLKKAQDRATLSGDVDEILNHSIGPASYHRDDVLKQQIMTHYRLNMMRMVRIAGSANAELMFVQPAINIKDMSPFKSEHRAGLDEEGQKQWQSLYQRARALHQAGELSEALRLYRQALEIDDRYADVHYRVGQVFFETGQYDEAEKAFRRAVEEDIVPLRILTAMQQIVEQVATQDAVPLIDFPSILRKTYLRQYDHAVFGEEIFLDHVHANMEGYRLLALALFDELVRQGVVTPDASWNEAHRKEVEQELVAALDPRIEGRMSLMLGKVLDWAGKHDEAHASFKRAFEILGPSPMIYDRLGRSAYLSGKHDDAILYLSEALERYPRMLGANENLAMLMEAKGKTDEAIEYCWAEIELNPSDHFVHTRLANLLEQKGDDAGALEHYQLSLAFEPDYEYALVKLAYLLIKQNRYDEALTFAQKALRVNPQQQRAHHALSLIKQKQGKPEQSTPLSAEASPPEPGHTLAEGNSQPQQTEHSRLGKAPTPYGENKSLFP
jgi:tetratricopeptide (TPR) repeat protein